jgi:hypothetical protein
MSLSKLEQLVFAYYVANGVVVLGMDPRFWRYDELAPIIEEKVRLATGKFGAKADTACSTVARALLDLLIQPGGFSTHRNDWGAMYQCPTEDYRNCIKELQESNCIILKARATGPDFWQAAFAASGNDGRPPLN